MIALTLALVAVVSSLSAQPQTPSPNILRNSSFMACANPGVPDWWGTGAPEAIEGFYGLMGTDADSPAPGTQSLRLQSGPGGETYTLQSYCYPSPPGTQYTLSLYLKSREPLSAEVAIGDQSTTLPVTTQWERKTFTATPVRGHWAAGRVIVRFGLGGPGTLWVAAPQLEIGPAATDYRPADADTPEATRAKPGSAVLPPVPSLVCPVNGRGTPGPSPVARDFTDINTGRAVSDFTSAYVYRDDRALHVTFTCGQTDKPRAKVTQRDGAVFTDDSVEVFLQPNPPKGPYVHLAVNALGTQFDELNLDPTWDAEWRVRTRPIEEGWEADLEIPFSSLPLSPNAPDVWRINLCRNRVTDGGVVNSSWSYSPGGYHQTERFGKLTGMGGEELAHFGYGLAGLSLTPAAKGLLLSGKLAGWPKDAEEVVLVAQLQQGADTPLTGRHLMKLSGAGVPFALAFNLPPGAPPHGSYQVVVAVKTYEGKLLHEVRESLTVTRSAAPTAAAPLAALFEMSYYTTEPTARLRVTWRGASGVKPTLTARLKPDGVPGPLKTSRAKAVLRQGDNLLTCPLEGLAPGEYEVTVSAGKGPATAVCALTKLPPAGTEVKINRFNRSLLVNGQPFLAYAQGIHGMRGGWWLDDIAAHGFNSIVANFGAYQSDAELKAAEPKVREFLDACLKRNLRVIVWLSPGSGAYPPMREAVVRTIRAFRDHPAILVWYLVDEPGGWWQGTADRKEGDLADLYQAALEADPYRPSQINWYSWAPGKGGYGSLDATDIGCLDRYPIGRGGNAMKSIADVARQMNVDCRKRAKLSAFWCQMYGLDDAVREPTPAEESCMTYLCVIHGMRLVYYFIYKPMSPDLWASMKPLGEELGELETLLCAPGATELKVAQTEAGVHYAVWRTGGKIVVVAANAGYDRARANLDLGVFAPPTPPDLQATVLFENRTVPLKAGKLTDTFEPCARHVYELP